MSTAPELLTDLLNELREAGVRLWVDASGLRCDAPKGAMSAELLGRLKENKSEIEALLRASRSEQADYLKDAVLEPSVGIHGTENGELRRVSRKALAAGSSSAKRSASALSLTNSTTPTVFLTGATGFLGSFLLHELLEQTDARVICLVRWSTDQSEEPSRRKPVLQRVQSSLENYGLWKTEDTDRIIAVPGNLSKSKLGLNAEDYARVVLETDTILHNGAHVHHGMPYASLKAPNVEGTRQTIKLAFEANARFHFVSSLSVLPPEATGTRTKFLEKEPLENSDAPQGGYNLSKWVAERLVEQAAERGLRTVVYRPGPISGDSRTGQFNENDFLCRLMQGYLVSGMAPEGELPLDVLPVDYVAKAIVWLAGTVGVQALACHHEQPSLRQVGGGDTEQAKACTPTQRFHLIHPDAVSSDVLFEACRNLGHEIKRVPYAQWFDHLTEIATSRDSSHPLYPLVALFSSRKLSNGAGTARVLPFDTSEAQAALLDAPFERPKLDVELFERYLAGVQALACLDDRLSLDPATQGDGGVADQAKAWTPTSETTR